jgi:hypothetical protein
MNDSTGSSGASKSPNGRDTGFSPWQQLKAKRISYLTLPLLVMATVTEFVILATGWKYQQVVCLPKGMGVTFFGIGPIGATILAVELLKLPLAIWTASRNGWQKGLMLMVGLPLICLLTFQLVKDMAVYEMGVAMTPAAEMLEKATAEETRVDQLKGELAAIEGKKADREQKLAELAAKEAKAKSDLEESLKRNEDIRHDAISLTEYQQKELSDVEAREASITKQFDADTEQITKSIADLRARREPEAEQAAQWNVEEARIENAYKAKLADYTNKKAAYVKDKAEYDNAGVLKRQVLKLPVDPGVPPERETNKILKPALLAEIDAQIIAKEAELREVNNKRRDRLAQVDADARKLREDFDRRSGVKREEADIKRKELSLVEEAVASDLKAQQKQVDEDLATAVQKVDGIRAEIDAASKRAEGFYMAREAAIRNTQVHRIATTVEIVRGLLKGERPMSIKASAKERGDILTDQISMVRIWVYPVLAFIVAFLPTLMVEIGFSTLFHPEKQRPAHRLGFFGRGLHQIEVRAGRQRILRAERQARESNAEISLRCKTLTDAKTEAEKLLAAKEAELQTAREAITAAAAAHEKQLKQKESESEARIAEVTESLKKALAEKEALLNSQQSEIDRQVQLLQSDWSERLNQLRKELDSQRANSEAERATMVREHQKKMQALSEEWRTRITQANRQLADAELAAEEKFARLSNELKEALAARDAANSQLQLQTESRSLELTQAKADAARELEKAARQEKQRLEQQQAEFAQTLRQANEEFDRQLRQREQELTSQFETLLAREQARFEQEARRCQEEFANQLEARISEADARWNLEMKQRDETAQAKLKQQEKQLQAQAEIQVRDAQTNAKDQLRRQELEFERRIESLSREAASRLQEELQKQDLAFHERLKQREEALNSRAAARETELHNQLAAELRSREAAWEQQAESRISAVEIRLTNEMRQKEEAFQQKIRQREHQLQSQFEAVQSEQQAKSEQELSRLSAKLEEAGRRELELTGKLSAQAEAHQTSEMEWKSELELAYRTIEPLRGLLARREKPVDHDTQFASVAMRNVQDLKQKFNTEAPALGRSNIPQN